MANYKYDISFFFPAIRTNLWENVYESLKKSCKKYNWELVFCGPFDLPDSLKEVENVKYIHETGNVSRAVQAGILQTNGKLIYIGNDDCTFRENMLDIALAAYNKRAHPVDIMQCTYVEGNTPQPNIYWTTQFHATFKPLAGVDQSWLLATEPILHRDYFLELGGFDCNWEYMDMATHDFMFRAQKNGSKIIYSPAYVSDMTWWPDHQGDHGPIHDAMVLHDMNLFKEVWLHKNDRLKIDYNNWKSAPAVWKRRFPSEVYESYEALWKGENYTHEHRMAPKVDK